MLACSRRIESTWGIHSASPVDRVHQMPELACQSTNMDEAP